MRIEFSCVCGKKYSVKAELAGKKAKCKKCGNPIKVPETNELNDEVDDEIVNAVLAPAAGESVPDPEHMIGDTYASNPGEVKVNKLKYIMSYPKWFWIWHGLGLISFGLCFWSLWFIPLVLFFLAACWFYWKRVTAQFLHGCANPGQVVSLDPPLVAAFTNLSKGACDTDVIKILQQPVKKFSTGIPTVGQKIATVALYDDNFPDSGHWSTFDPKPVACVTNDQQAIQGVMGTFTSQDWKELGDAMAQVPTPYLPGHYRIYSPKEFKSRPRPDGDEIKSIVQNGLDGQDNVFLFRAIDNEKLVAVGGFIPSDAVNTVWGIVSATAGDCKEALVFSDVGVFYNFKATGSGRFSYENVIGGLSSNSGLEVMLRDRTRIRISKSHFLNRLLGRLDAIFDQIAGRDY